MLSSLASWIPSFGRPFGGNSYGAWEEGYGTNQGGFGERFDGYVPAGPYGEEYRMVMIS